MSEIFTHKKLYRAYWACRKTKRKTINALNFEFRLEENIESLRKELIKKTYRVGTSICFVVEKPVMREIFAGEFRDRIIHHLVVNELESIGEGCFVYDSFACRKDKGTHSAVDRLEKHIHSFSKKTRKPLWYLQLDISGFFMSIDHQILFDTISRMIERQNKSYQWKQDLLWLVRLIIFHKPTQKYRKKGNLSLFPLLPERKSLFFSPEGKGLPIGNYSSQFFANVYLNHLDQYVKRTLKCRYYIRYVDDFILLGTDVRLLKKWRDAIEYFLGRSLFLFLNKEKTKIRIISCGIDFLGYFIKPQCQYVRKRLVRKVGSYLWGQKKVYAINKKLGNSFLSSIHSYLGHYRHADSYYLRKRTIEKALEILGEEYYADEKYLKICTKDSFEKSIKKRKKDFSFLIDRMDRRKRRLKYAKNKEEYSIISRKNFTFRFPKVDKVFAYFCSDFIKNISKREGF